MVHGWPWRKRIFVLDCESTLEYKIYHWVRMAQKSKSLFKYYQKIEKLTKWIDKNIYFDFKISMLYFSYVRYE